MSVLYGYKQMRNGKWRLYKSVEQAVTAWRGTNDKVTVVRNLDGEIMNFDSLEQLQEVCRRELKASAYDMKDW